MSIECQVSVNLDGPHAGLDKPSEVIALWAIRDRMLRHGERGQKAIRLINEAIEAVEEVLRDQ